MKYKIIWFFIVLTVCFFASCDQPVGGITGSGGADLFLVIAVRDEINLEDQNVDRTRFYRRSDCVKVYGAKIYDSDLILEILTDPLSVDPDSEEEPIHFVLSVSGPSSYYEFILPGQYLLRGTYKGKTDEHPIIVYARNTDNDGTSNGITWEWLP